jgi:hypothetical protein
VRLAHPSESFDVSEVFCDHNIPDDTVFAPNRSDGRRAHAKGFGNLAFWVHNHRASSEPVCRPLLIDNSLAMRNLEVLCCAVKMFARCAAAIVRTDFARGGYGRHCRQGRIMSLRRGDELALTQMNCL